MSQLFRNLMLCVSVGLASSAQAQTAKTPAITRDSTLYLVPYAHLDTQWRWEFPQTISEYLLKTMRVNFYYIDKYPHYVFNWTGSNRYRLMKEYFPSDYERMRHYIAQGRWFPAGSSVEEGDVNLPSAESIFRQILYGNTYFRKEFGKASNEYMLPDCFGFPASLPTILAHAGIKGFSTQKLAPPWRGAPLAGGPDSPEQTPDGVPFNLGLWEGPDGKTVLAALNPLVYSSRIRYDLSKPLPSAILGLQHAQTGEWFEENQDWVSRIALDGKATGVYADYHYVGTGDTGGATDEDTVKILEATVTRGKTVLPQLENTGAGAGSGVGAQATQNQPVRVGDGPVRVLSTAADQMFLDIKPDMTGRMPRYKGDMELINHTPGSLTSQAYHKRWNRKNEILADEAERASVAAAWLGGRPYPRQRLNDAWTLVMAGQFHDTAAGTATPRAYQFAWNDDIIALNQFADVLLSATEAVASALDTRAEGIPIVVYNSLNIEREDIVEAMISFPGGVPKAVSVFGPDGREVQSQVEDGKVMFDAKVPPVGYAVYDVRRSSGILDSTELKVTANSLENACYRITLNDDGDVASIFYKAAGKELLSGPIRLAISNDAPLRTPAWNMEFDQEQAVPRSYVSGPAKVRVAERGPVRVAIEVSRETDRSRFVQTVRLSAGGAGNRVEFNDAIDWRALSANLKAVFPLSASNPLATYNWEVGTIQRPNAFDRQFEVASHYWIDLTDKSGTYGTAILTDVKNASDKRDDQTLRLTLLRSPGFPSTGPGQEPARRSYSDQLNQDWGHHEILYGIAGHSGDWRQDQTDWQAYRMSTPLLAFTTAKHQGALGRRFSLVSVSDPQIRILALKKAEMSNEVILRMVEVDGKEAKNVSVRFAGPIASAHEVNAQEQPLGPASVVNGTLVSSFSPYEPRTFALILGAPPARVAPVESLPVTLRYNLAAASNNDTETVGGFDSNGNALPAEMLPFNLKFNDVNFRLAQSGTGKPDALVAQGQTIKLRPGNFNKVYLLAASTNGDQKSEFRVGTHSALLTIQNWGGFIGQWDTRVWEPAPDAVAAGNDPTHTVSLRKDWAVSANHATWVDMNYRGSPNWSPRYPEDYRGLMPGYIKRADLAWYADHYHTLHGLNEPYAYSYLFGYSIKLPHRATTLTLPKNDSIRILAISLAREEPDVTPVQPLYDVLPAQTENPQEYSTSAL